VWGIPVQDLKLAIMVFSNCNTTINPVPAIGLNDAKLLVNLGAVEMTTYSPVCGKLMNQSCNSSCEAFTLGHPKINLNDCSLHDAPLVVIADKLRSRCNFSVGPVSDFLVLSCHLIEDRRTKFVSSASNAVGIPVPSEISEPDIKKI
jgi:hypothetical protein